MRWPRPSRLEEPLDVPKGKLAEGLRTLGLTSVGALLEHLPRDSREARTVAALKTGEQATVAVQVRSIAARSVRRRGMKPLVEASVFDETGTMRATFFNQPWLAQRYEPGTRLVLHGKTTERGRSTSPITRSARRGRSRPSVDAPAAGAERRRRRRGARSPTIRRRTARARRRSWRWCRAPETRWGTCPRRCRRGRG